MQPKPKKRVVYKKLNIPFTKELYQALEQKSESEHRSMTGQILTILENNLLKKDEPK